jgi:GT2 family glycosyltransferase
MACSRANSSKLQSLPNVSILTLFYNRWDLAHRYVAQWREAGVDPGEVQLLLGDCGSTDGSADVAASAADIADVTLLPGNLGYSGGNNLLAKKARGRLLVFLNYDVHFTPNWLEELVAVFSGRPGLGVAGNVQLSVRARATDHAGIFFDASGHPYHFRPAAALVPALGYFPVPAVTGACMAVRRELFEGLGGFDEGFRNSHEDVDFCLRARARGVEVGLAARSTIWHHVGSSPGRHESEAFNASRFEERWAKDAASLASAQPPELAGGPGIHPVLAADETLRVYFPSTKGYSEKDTALLIYPRNRWVDVELPLPAALDTSLFPLRLDPTQKSGEFRISGISLRREGESRPFWEIEGERLAGSCPASGTCTVRNTGRELVFESTGNDAQVLVRIPPEVLSGPARIWFKVSIWNNCPEPPC